MRGRLVVDFDRSQATPEDLVRALARAGYEARVLEVTALEEARD